jgi:hypothetical protein
VHRHDGAALLTCEYEAESECCLSSYPTVRYVPPNQERTKRHDQRLSTRTARFRRL